MILISLFKRVFLLAPRKTMHGFQQKNLVRYLQSTRLLSYSYGNHAGHGMGRNQEKSTRQP